MPYIYHAYAQTWVVYTEHVLSTYVFKGFYYYCFYQHFYHSCSIWLGMKQTYKKSINAKYLIFVTRMFVRLLVDYCRVTD